MSRLFDGTIRNREEAEEHIREHGHAAREVFGRNYFGQAGLGLEGVDMKNVAFRTFDVEFLVKGDHMIFHFYPKDGHQFPQNFRSLIWRAMIHAFRLKDRHERVEIEWVGEVGSWCVTIKSIAVISPPEDELVLEALAYVENPDAIQE